MDWLVQSEYDAVVDVKQTGKNIDRSVKMKFQYLQFIFSLDNLDGFSCLLDQRHKQYTFKSTGV